MSGDAAVLARLEDWRAHCAASHECCASCASFTPVSGRCGMCSVVQGPYEGGHVHADDRCELWEPAAS